jgi:trehalose 6-phosphate synthase
MQDSRTPAEHDRQRRPGRPSERPADADDDAMADSDGQLLVVSNRQPYKHVLDDGDVCLEKSIGGLTAGLDPVMRDRGGTWIAWGDGEADERGVDGGDCVAVPPEDPAYTLRRVWLSDEQVDDYYYGFSNRVLWPSCHGMLSKVHYEGGYWEQYQSVNRTFADAIVDHTDDGGVVWFHDYHLALAPEYVAESVDGAVTLAHFWHVPWPTWDTFRRTPYGRSILAGLLHNDLLGFHVHSDVENFLDCVDAAFPEATVDADRGIVDYRGHRTTVRAIPMGAPVERIEDLLDETTRSMPEFVRTAEDVPEDVQLAVGVDRLDYTKGIPERLQALERFFEDNPDWRGELTYIQNGSESRSRIPAYEALQDRVRQQVAHINERFGTDEWRPVLFTTDELPQSELYALYRAADLALVSPHRDGMNLVALEYVASQLDDEGILLLSDRAGAHELLGDEALTITPGHTEDFAATVDEALRMSADEQRRRMRELRRRVRENDLAAWVDQFLTAVAALDRPTKRAVPDRTAR